MHLTTPLSKVLRTTKDYIEVLDSMGLHTVEDLLLYLPRAHEDLSLMHTLGSAPLDTKVTISGIVDTLKLIRTRTGKQLVTGKFLDSEGTSCEVIWFNQPHIKRMLSDGQDTVLTGKLVENGYKLQMQSPTFEKAGGGDLVHSGRLVPIYPQHDKINTKWLREKINSIKESIEDLRETLPVEVVEEEKFLSRADAVYAMHFPEDPEQVQKALDRFAFEDLYAIQINALNQKKEWQGERNDKLKIPMNVDHIKHFFASLKFTPTNSQKVAIFELLTDMEKNVPMSRLLEGDVGSGKTLVATAVIANVIEHGGQCAFMVPTEVLAKQHTESIGKTLVAFHNYCQKEGIDMPCPKVALLTGSTPKGQAEETRANIEVGNFDLIIGTHSLIEDKVQFHNLRLVIVDEQHRFGVAQRDRLKSKGSPHFLSMTATPIPRTLALTAYGHHDLSVLTEKPGNRKPIHTKVVSPTDRKTVELFIDKEIEAGRQAFVICPLIKESKNEDFSEIKNVEAEKKRLDESFSHRKIAMLHGKMTPQEKENIMRSFKEKEYDILVSTSVIEVGIDIPNSTIIVIEGSERFGLSQLHQFRGRVGRSDIKSHCFLFTTSPEQARSARLKAMEKHDSGFQLAEIDLKLRGPGEMFGLRQSGIPEISVANLLNPELVVRARKAAQKYLKVA
ncbi:MAG: ATP-dependent DNA helicase RecG [Candidatus Peribacter sp.]|jgi:ATP-dependent DNA helicase RecG|nr:ATP-dependent DNA helicase RecG [Candidatus Peribacter sp.]MBT4392447.1 ATP-dependent DNA helicase RecG [Candidatus Peribacter sp.]MBT4601223.1 ATP-dependent DNA helicase RecG [Candidatus Peribacter sp.]MBT5149272.1 ATP-dependent DNA helicase RecG [Candidatus Peribacter sp.]MBT5637096.1 ATP-dependent DNA helicase RecG [Candidatus Peribacter sp.]